MNASELLQYEKILFSLSTTTTYICELPDDSECGNNSVHF